MNFSSIVRTYPRQGEIYLISNSSLSQPQNLEINSFHLVVIVSINIRNHFTNSVLVVPLTADLKGWDSPTRIFIPQGEGSLETDFLAVCDNLATLRQNYLVRGNYTEISHPSLLKIQRGIQLAIGIY